MRQAQHKIAPQSKDRYVTLRRQAGSFRLAKIGDERDLGLIAGGKAQDADASRLDQSANGGRGGCGQAVACYAQFRPVIGHQNGAECDEIQGKRGFSAARGAEDQEAPSLDRDATGMQRLGPGRVQTGRPTTKRAPSGSEVMSAWVGRMFSAQMTPPCASMICFEIARPRPEWLPKSDFGRSE